MKISVSRVPPEGLKDHATYHPSTLDMERDDIHVDQPFTVDAFIAKAEQELVVRAEIACSLRLTCARCLEEFSSTISADAVWSYHVKPTEIVDITEDVRQEIILAYPMIPMCRPECKGLCPVCGQNLNTASCAHQQEDSHGTSKT